MTTTLPTLPATASPRSGGISPGISFGAVTVHTVETPALGDRSYVLAVGDVAVVVDPQRDIDRLLDFAQYLDVEISHVLETHIHNDYASGGYALSVATGAQYLLSAADPVRFSATGLRDGDEIAVADGVRLRVFATPGHTRNHLAYVLDLDARPAAVFTGGSLLYGATGRTDLLGSQHAETLAHAQWNSARRLAGSLPDDVTVLPTHGFGSFCSATAADVVATSTIGRERNANAALTDDESRYVAALLAGFDAYPAYYTHMAELNLAGATAADLAPPTVADAAQLHDRLRAGEWVVDLRNRTAYAAGHLAGTLNFGVDGGLASYLGWLIPWGMPFTLLGADADQVARAQRELSRIGIERPAAQANGDPRGWTTGPLEVTRRATFAELAAEWLLRPEIVVLDVRRRGEWHERHLAGAIGLPLHELPSQLDNVPDGELWVHCAAGYRAATAVSLLLRAGHDAVLIDDDLALAEAHGLRVVTKPDIG